MVVISVIMPLYNAERYLEEALHSILAQTYKEFELICINDASTDATLEILKRFQNEDNRIRIIENEERLGAAISRNRGIKASRGKYITFLDGDDIFEEEMLNLSYKAMEKYNTDLVMYECKHIPSESIHEKRVIQRRDSFIEKYCKRPFSMKDCRPIEIMHLPVQPYSKLYRKSFIENNRLHFQSLPCCNDVYFGEMALYLAKRMIMLNDRRIMVYIRDHDTPTRISYDRDPMCAFFALEKLGKELKKRDMLQQVSEHFSIYAFFIFCYSLRITKKQDIARKFYMFLCEKGIDIIETMIREYSNKSDSYAYGLLGNFKTLDFDLNWYSNEDSITYYLHKNIKRVMSLFETYKNRNIKIALWGAGLKGRAVLSVLNEYGLQVSEVIDIDKSKQGKTIAGYRIESPDVIRGKVRTVLTCTYDVYCQVSEKIVSEGIEVIDLEDIISLA